MVNAGFSHLSVDWWNSLLKAIGISSFLRHKALVELLEASAQNLDHRDLWPARSRSPPCLCSHLLGAEDPTAKFGEKQTRNFQKVEHGTSHSQKEFANVFLKAVMVVYGLCTFGAKSLSTKRARIPYQQTK